MSPKHNKVPSRYSFLVEYEPMKGNILYPIVNDSVVNESLVELNKLNEITDIRQTRNDQPPEILHKENPIYPGVAKKVGIRGRVILEIIIDKQGNVIQAKVVKSDHNLLNQPSINAALECKFTPGIKNGKPVKSKIFLNYLFELKSGNPN